MLVAVLSALLLAQAAQPSAPPVPSSPQSVAAPDPRCAADPSIVQTSAVGNFPDPFVFCASGVLYAVSTNSRGAGTGKPINVPVAQFTPRQGWRLRLDAGGGQADALQALPPWAAKNDGGGALDLWAPEVMKVGARYVLYFSARHASARTPAGAGRPCIGAAVSDNPAQGFAPQTTALLCTEFAEGVIDPSPFADGGRLYLYFKSDGNCCGLRAGIYVSELRPDGLAVLGAPQALGVVNDRLWEGAVVEAPTVTKHGGRYVLLYSGEVFSSADYGVGYAICDTLRGPCAKPQEGRPGDAEDPSRRVLRKAEALEGPGHQSVFQAGGRDWIAFHALVPGTPRDWRAVRNLHVAPLDWVGDRPVAQVR